MATEFTGFHASIVERLQRAKRHWRTVARIAGVPYHTLTRVAQQASTAPRIDTLEKLALGLKEFEHLRREVHAETKKEMLEASIERLERLKSKPKARKSKTRNSDGVERTPEREGSAA